MEKSILIIKNLTKEYEKKVALDDISFEVERGSIFGLLGPNGAGKTSLIRILTGISIADKGEFNLIDNKSTADITKKRNFDDLSKMIGYLPEERGLYNDMKIIEQLEFIGMLKGLNKNTIKQNITEYSQKLGIDAWLDKKARELSKGMQQLVQFVATIFYEPELIILDEPFTGLDPINTNKMKEEIINLKEKGNTIIFSTHRMEQVEEICENIALINNGKIVLNGKINEIKKTYKKDLYKIEHNGELSISNDIKIVEHLGDNVSIIKNESADKSVSDLLKRLIVNNEITSFIEIFPSLNEIFIECVEANSKGELTQTPLFGGQHE
jgi:ABC-2 type transport system ATP-binding protein